MRRLVDSWVQAEAACGNTLAEAIRVLNEGRGTKATHSRVAEWRRGRYVPQPRVLSYLLFRTLRHALSEAGIAVSDAQFEALTRQLWWMKEERGKTYVELL